jgi:hypothetical protein
MRSWIDMPSDERVTVALAALARPAAEFRALLQSALAQGESFVVEQNAGDGARAARAGAELGLFAAGRMDGGRFAALLPRAKAASAPALEALDRAMAALRELIARGDALFVADVPPAGNLGATIGAALGQAGRALNAVMLIEAVRAGLYDSSVHARLLAASAFLDWNKAERRVAPPLIVTVDGASLHAGALADYADGRLKLVLVVRGACPPAALARCITPGTFVLQTMNGAGLERLAAFDGPAVAALVPDGAAQFVHDPIVGREPWQRITILADAAAPKRAIGGMSVYQMSEDLRVLHDLARTPFAVPVAGGAAAPAMGSPDAVDKIASWLLGQSGLPGNN